MPGTVAIAIALVALLAMIFWPQHPTDKTFATLEQTRAALWESGDLPTADGSRLGQGTLRLAEGLATLRFDSGAEVVLEAPATLILTDAMSCELTRGTAVSDIPESALGFRIKTPSADVVDYGTRFAVSVHEETGETHTQVIEGRVQVEYAQSDEVVELSTGQRNTVVGDTIGKVTDDAEHEHKTIAVKPLDHGPDWSMLEPVRDAYTGKNEDHNSGVLLLVKKVIRDGRVNRIAYIGFDLKDINQQRIEEAELLLYFAPTGWGLASHMPDATFSVYGMVKHPFDPPSTIRPIGTRSATVSDFIGQFKKAQRHHMVVIERRRVDGPTWATFTAVMAGDGRTARGTFVNQGGNYGLMFMVRREFLSDFEHLLTEEGRHAEAKRRWIGIEKLEAALDTQSMDTARIEWWQQDRDRDGKLHYEEFPHPESAPRPETPGLNIVIGRIGDYALGKPSPDTVRKVQREIADEDPRGAWVDVDDLNDKEVNGKIQSVVHFNRPDGYITLGRRFARQGHALVTGKDPAEDGRPGHREPKEREKNEKKKTHAAEATPLKASEPNIIIIMPDDIGYGDIASLGNPVVQTPNLDSLKRESLLFTQYHVSPRCSPSRAVLMSGRHEFMSGVTHTQHGRERMSLDTVTLPQGLQSVGYTTGHFGKWHIGREKPYRPENRGFDESYGIEGGGTPKLSPRIFHNGVRQKKKDGYATDMFFERAFAWMDEKRKEDAPFFAYIAPNDAHGPYTGLHNVPGNDYKKYLGKHPEVTEDTAKVYWMIENIDRHVGTMLSKLEEWKIAENTLVIYIGSDNGNSTGWKVYNAGMKGHKGQPYQGGTRVPVFFRWPEGNTPADAECSALTSQMDLMPTLLEITGAPLTDPIKQQVEGRSLVPLIKNPAADWDDDRHLVHHVGAWEQGQAAQSKHARVSIQNKRFTLVNTEELYDLKTDPGETENVIAEYPEVVDQLRTVYDQWWIRIQPRLVNEDAYQPPAK